MKKCPYNVSSKSYDKFIKRIESVIPEGGARDRMIKAVQLYLTGCADTCMEGLDARCRMAFEFLRFELDEALRRSALARERARRRKLSTGAVPESASESVPETVPESSEIQACECVGVLPPEPVGPSAEVRVAQPVIKSRLQRRAERRKGKLRWRAIS